MSTKKKLNTYKVQLNEREDQILDEICKYSRLTKSNAILFMKQVRHLNK